MERYIVLDSTNLYFLKYPRRVKNKSLRLNLFPDMKALLPKDIDKNFLYLYSYYYK